VNRPSTAQPAAIGIEQMLAEARARLQRLTPHEAYRALDRGAILVDMRGDDQRARDGAIPGARFIARNVLEWRADPKCAYRDPAIARPEAIVALICDEGYQSSLAAETLQRLGLSLATDVIGGFQAWRAAGLPVSPPASAELAPA
jgi:rhodanese-related sulfurtransferase